MQQKLSLVVLTVLLIPFLATAQNSDSSPDIELKGVPISPTLLSYNNPLESEGVPSAADSSEQAGLQPSGFEKDVMARIVSIYRIHVKAIEAQLNDNPLKAEEYITDALGGLQELLDKYPEVQSDQRFSEVYRSVMTEYRKFYGVKGSESQVEGEIFAIQKELYSDDNDWVKDSYNLPENIPTNRTEVPLVQNKSVNKHLMYFSMKRPQVMEKWLMRSEKYFPMMKEIFEEEGVPQELIHLSMVESGLNPTAKSWASAVGMWQFIRSTASMYGLEVNWWVDERQDPEKATRAAAQHLKDLYEVWGDWHLAMAGYNISPRGLKSAIRRAGGQKDYWAASPYLPRETRNYVPGFIAATMIEMNPESFGFKKEYQAAHYDYDVYRVAPLMPLDRLAEAAGITLDKLKEYNPELLRWATPPGNEYPLKLPLGTEERFASNYENIPKDERGRNVAMHTVNRGESLGHIARKYGTSVRALYETNENLSSTIYPGQKIVVPLAPGSKKEIAANRPTNQSKSKTTAKKSTKNKSSNNSNKARIRYQVKSGDTVGHIAEWFDSSSSRIRSWNNTSNVIRPGEYLTIYVPKAEQEYYQKVDGMSFSKKQQIERQQQAGKEIKKAYLASSSKASGEYTVQPNDTLIDIANSHGISVSRIKQLNGLNGSRIYVGQKLKVGAPE
ncbi:LysM peptidoglycan-binding domain-containing protein [Fodinibius salsisoli]|uniref:LysM peptidoglycan-binding domain-containing protein n=1 Tax=Fodinibius salsisoli TaxID=2820877 RepID=A0ABT3PPI8_9BACT|nr:LysM peptidoglycan-binding domain-containing protein [Fodinibius salsisoli]MCW9707771.1 LysM peptidoglycan-binding domain-containing protein [Fodinibius salsisoli]